MTVTSQLLTRRLLGALLAGAILTGTSVEPVHAGMMSTEQAANQASAAQAAQLSLQALAMRREVAKALEANGVAVQDVKARLAALTDTELLQLQHDIDSAPAGAGVVGAAVFVFLVLLGTDIVGVTKVFPFTKPVR